MVLDLHTAQDKKRCSLSHDVGTNSVFFHSPHFALSAVCMSGYLTVLPHFAHGKEYTVQTSFLTLLVRNRGLKLLQEGCVVCACNLDRFYHMRVQKRKTSVANFSSQSVHIALK